MKEKHRMFIINVPPANLKEGDILVRIDDGMARATLIGEFRGLHAMGLQVWNPTEKGMELITDLPDEVQVLIPRR